MLSLPCAAKPSDIQKEELVGSNFLARQADARAKGQDGGSDSTALKLPHTAEEVDELFQFIFNE